MPQLFFPTEALDYLKTCATERFQVEIDRAKEFAIAATGYHVEKRLLTYLSFVTQLVSFYFPSSPLVHR